MRLSVKQIAALNQPTTNRALFPNLNEISFVSNYKVYCRAIESVDITLAGGFSLVGYPMRVEAAAYMPHNSYHKDGIMSFQAEIKSDMKDPFVFCIDKLDPGKIETGQDGKTYRKVTSRLGFLMLHRNSYLSPSPTMPFDGDDLSGDAVAYSRTQGMPLKASKPVVVNYGDYEVTATEFGDYFCFATYLNKGRRLWADDSPEIASVLSTPTHNPYKNIAQDIDMLSAYKIVRLPAVTNPENLANQLEKALNINDRVYPKTLWAPGSKFIGEISGLAIVREVSRFGGHAEIQPKFIAEAILANYSELSQEQANELLEILDFQEKSFAGQVANIAIARQLLGKKIKRKHKD